MKKRMKLATLISILALSGLVGANLANATGGGTSTPVVVTDSDSDSVEHECPPACNAQDQADEATEAADAAEAPEGNEAPGAEADGDTHEDVGDQANHECPPECDIQNGETQ